MTIETKHVVKTIRATNVGGQMVKPGVFLEVSRIDFESLEIREFVIPATPEELAANPAIIIAPAPAYESVYRFEGAGEDE